MPGDTGAIVSPGATDSNGGRVTRDLIARIFWLTDAVLNGTHKLPPVRNIGRVDTTNGGNDHETSRQATEG